MIEAAGLLRYTCYHHVQHPIHLGCLEAPLLAGLVGTDDDARSAPLAQDLYHLHVPTFALEWKGERR